MIANDAHGGFVKSNMRSARPRRRIAKACVAAGVLADWVLDASNVVACCRSCNDLFNRDPGVTTIPTSLDAFFDLRDALCQSRRERILSRRSEERAWFEAHVLPALAAHRAEEAP